MKLAAIIPDKLMNDLMTITGLNKTDSVKIAIEYFINRKRASNSLKRINNNNIDIDSLTESEMKSILSDLLYSLEKIIINK